MIEVMKVYLDYQLWDYINKNDNVKKFFQLQKEEKEWRYFISVAHLEEIYRARKYENIDKAGMTDSLEMTIRSMSEDGVIKPTEQGVKYIYRSYEKIYQDIVTYDTIDIVRDRSLIRKQMDKSAYNPQNLFEGVTHKIEDEYKIVWETERVKQEVAKLSDISKKIKEELSLPNNSLVIALNNMYGKVEAKKQLERMLSSSDVEIKPAIYQNIQDDYGKLEYVIEQLYFVLTKCGFKRDGSDKHSNSGTYDIQHSICATLCDIFITNDNRFADKFMAVAYFLGIPIEIIKWKDLQSHIKNQ
jgi:hypothetical protein